MKINTRKYSIIIIACALALAVFGCVMVYSASKHSAMSQYGNEFFYLKKQIMGVAIGLVGLIVCYFINNKSTKNFIGCFI